ncbi:MAG: hypothetical protein ACYDHY_15860 [Acidiferrobacterales bacterium]
MGFFNIIFGPGWRHETLHDAALPSEGRPQLGAFSTLYQSGIGRLTRRRKGAEHDVAETPILDPEVRAAAIERLRAYRISGYPLATLGTILAISALWYGFGYLVVGAIVSGCGGLISITAERGITRLQGGAENTPTKTPWVRRIK